MRGEIVAFIILGLFAILCNKAIDDQHNEIRNLMHPSFEVVKENARSVGELKDSVLGLKRENVVILSRVDEILIRLERNGIK